VVFGRITPPYGLSLLVASKSINKGQRIVCADNETNYCAHRQTGGRLLADRSLSRLLHRDWPKTVDEWEARHRPAG